METYHNSSRIRAKRRKTLAEGNCSCGLKADVTWHGKEYCFKCWEERRKDEKRKANIGYCSSFVSFIRFITRRKDL